MPEPPQPIARDEDGPGAMLGQAARQLGGQTIIYGIGGAALQLVGIVTLPVLARIFDPGDYGVLELGFVLSAILMIVVDGGMASASQRSYFDYGEDEETERRRVLSTALLVQLALGAAVAAILVALAAPVSRLLLGGREESMVMVLVGVTLPVFAVAQFTREILRLEFRAWAYLISSVAGAIVGAAVTVLAVTAWDLGVEGAFVGILAGYVLSAAIGLLLTFGRLLARPSRFELGVMVRYGVPLIPAALSLWALALIDRVMLARLADLDELGQYALANRLAVPVLIVVTALALAFSPFILSLHQSDPEREKRVRARVLTDFTAVLCLIGLISALWARELGEIVAPGYDEAYRSVGIVAFGLVAFGISSVVVAGISISRRTSWIAVLSAASALVNVVLNLLLIPPFGQVGAAVATLVAYLVLVATYFHRAQRLYPTPYRPWAVAATFLAGLALMPLGAVAYGSWVVAQPVKVLAVVAFLVLLRPAGVLAAGDAGRAIALARARWPRRASAAA